MILADTSIWADHFRRDDARFRFYLEASEIIIHPFITGELALGNLRDRSATIEALRALPEAPVVTHEEALVFISAKALAGRGIGYVDAHLLASTHLMPGARLWTRDRRLAALAFEMAIGFDPA